jgi:hypothetical protein
MPVGRVVIGVIDSGIAFAHVRFRNLGGTRISNLWRQDFMGGPGPGPFAPGVQLSSGGINAAIAAAGGDEDAVYRGIGGLGFTTGGFKPLARRRSHGTHVLDLAAGDDSAANVTDRPIIAVDMPDDAVGDPAGSTLTIHAFLGLLHIMREAQALVAQNETLPVVVNLSYGPHEGPHDGTGPLEQIMDFMVRIYRTSSTPLKIVLAAGNYRQKRIHAQFNVPALTSVRMHWRLQPCSLSASLMEIWFAAAGAQATVTLTSPLGQRIAVWPVNPSARLTNVATEVLMLAQFLTSPSNGRSYVVLNTARTAFDPAAPWGQAIVPSGVWIVDVMNNGNAPVSFDAWIKRSDTPPGHPAKGRQSYFEDMSRTYQVRPEEFDRGGPSHIVRAGTLSGIATGVHTEVIGGYRRGDNGSDLHPAPYSSAGPHSNSTRAQSAPDWVEVTDDSIACAGVCAAGTRSGSSVAMNGTSAAAPQAVRWIASQWLSTGVRPNRPPLVAPTNPLNPNPLNPIPPAEVIPVVGGGLRLTPQRRGRPS